jgi:hypothetical protein
MKTKMIIKSAFILAVFTGVASCNKNQCHACHYDKDGAEIELGEKCGDELEQLEANGYTDTTGTYTVHCHGH